MPAIVLAARNIGETASELTIYLHRKTFYLQNKDTWPQCPTPYSAKGLR